MQKHMVTHWVWRYWLFGADWQTCTPPPLLPAPTLLPWYYRIRGITCTGCLYQLHTGTSPPSSYSATMELCVTMV